MMAMIHTAGACFSCAGQVAVGCDCEKYWRYPRKVARYGRNPYLSPAVLRGRLRAARGWHGAGSHGDRIDPGGAGAVCLADVSLARAGRPGGVSEPRTGVGR